MRVSIIIPVYNVSEYLVECLDSVCRQTYTNLEILLIDDGSTDGSGYICDEYAKKDSRITVYHKQNGGLSDARNYGIDRMNGTYLTFIDSDDRVTEDYVERLISVVKYYDVPFALATFSTLKDDQLILTNSFPYSEEVISEKEYLDRSYHSPTMKQVSFITSWGKLYHRDLFENVRFPVGKLHEDVFTTYKLAIAAKQIVCINAFIYQYRLRENSIMTSPYSLKRLDALEAYKEMIDYLQRYGYETRDTEYTLLRQYSDECLRLYANGFLEEYREIRAEFREFLKSIWSNLTVRLKLKWMIQYYFTNHALLKMKQLIKQYCPNLIRNIKKYLN